MVPDSVVGVDGARTNKQKLTFRREGSFTYSRAREGRGEGRSLRISSLAVHPGGQQPINSPEHASKFKKNPTSKYSSVVNLLNLDQD